MGVNHSVGGLLHIVDERIEKILQWPVPTNPTGARSFLGAIGIARRWIKNYYEIARPLTRLTGSKTPWVWGEAEQLSYEILKYKCAARVAMHGIDPKLVNHFYTDASQYAAGMCLTQFQPAI